MPAYRFEALDAAGKSQTGLLDADNAKAARSQLRARSLVPLAVTPVATAANDAKGGARFTRRGIEARVVSAVTGEGLPELLEAVHARLGAPGRPSRVRTNRTRSRQTRRHRCGA